MPELPLRLRLIGLRVTKLKDLRADADAKATGIKRVRLERSFPDSTLTSRPFPTQFFDSVSGPVSPNKRRRIEANSEAKSHIVVSLSQDGYEEAMPGFHEHDEDDGEHIDVGLGEGVEPELEHEHHLLQGSLPRIRPPASAPARTSDLPSAKPVSGRSKPSSARFVMPTLGAPDGPSYTGLEASSSRLLAPQQALAQPDDVVHTQTCPICGKSLETDNHGLNTHIDFCLSKQAILEAQTSATVSTRKFTVSKQSPGRRAGKPRKGAGRK